MWDYGVLMCGDGYLEWAPPLVENGGKYVKYSSSKSHKKKKREISKIKWSNLSKNIVRIVDR